MKIEFRESFLKDLRSIKDKQLLSRLRETIQAVESATSLLDIQNIKKLRGGKGFYRVRIGEYRLGLVAESDLVIFVRFLNRKDIYRYFP